MEPLLNQLRELPKALAAFPAWLKLVVVVGALAGIGVAAMNAVNSAEAFQYAFTNLTPEDSTEAGSALKAAGVPFRLDAGGTALAVPQSKVYDARLLLAAAGLPRGGGIGFEIFDRGDLGVSEFTQKVNLRRATEGELARTISKLAQVRSARVHLTLSEKGLYRDQDHGPQASVVVNLQPGRALSDREVSGIRHLVASAVSGLTPQSVAVVDNRGDVLSAEGPTGEAISYQRRVEKDLEQRVIDLIGQAVGQSAVIARITALVDNSEVQTTAQVVDPDATAVRSERKTSQQSTGEASASGGTAGAAANQPLAASAPATAGGRRNMATTEDQTRNFEVSITNTTTVNKSPRLQRLSVAVLVDGVNGQPRPDAELARLGELAKRAVGFDADRGDTFEISSSPFVKVEEPAAETPVPPAFYEKPWFKTVLYGVGGLLALLVVAFALRGKGGGQRAGTVQDLTIQAGSRVAEIEAALLREASAGVGAARPALGDPAAGLRERAKELATKDPTRAAHILKAWMAADPGHVTANRSQNNG